MKSRNLKFVLNLKQGEFSAQVIEVLSVYKNLASNNEVLLGQRPMKIPNLRRISPRVIQTYILRLKLYFITFDFRMY